MRRAKRWTAMAAAMLLAGGAAAQPAPAGEATPAVRVTGGMVAGRATGDVAAFKGIPFAAPPVGALRWRAPQPVARWSGTRAADSFGHDCMQKPFPSDAAPLGTEPAEDCLTINVWTPAAAVARGGAQGRRPVLVWIYGGGFVNGGSSPAVYDGSAFARQDVVFVSMNYRLGRFGFFGHPALTAAHQGPLGNYGLLDQVAALQWVRANIAAFGGDPTRVTLVGESAGGSSVLNLMASPMAKGLFQQALVMSGGGRKLVGGAPLRGGDAANPSAEQVGVNFARSMGIEGSGADALARLRALSAAQVTGDINLAYRGPTDAPTFIGGPVVDGELVVGTTDDAMRTGRAMALPMMVGTTDADIGFFTATSKAALFGTGAAADRLRAAYDPTGAAALAAIGPDLSRDRLMTEPARFVAQQTARVGRPAWYYRFGYVADSMRGEWKGAPHATDIPFFFDTVRAKYGDALTPKDAAAARLINRYVVNFVKSGDPNGGDLPRWDRFTPAGEAVLQLTPDASARSGADPLKPRLDAVEASYAPE